MVSQSLLFWCNVCWRRRLDEESKRAKEQAAKEEKERHEQAVAASAPGAKTGKK